MKTKGFGFIFLVKVWILYPSLIWYSIKNRKLPIWLKEDFDNINRKVEAYKVIWK